MCKWGKHNESLEKNRHQSCRQDLNNKLNIRTSVIECWNRKYVLMTFDVKNIIRYGKIIFLYQILIFMKKKLSYEKSCDYYYNQHNSRIIIYSANLCSIPPPTVIYYSSVQNTLSELIRCVKYDETQSLLISHTHKQFIGILMY